jgi:hypothetical protein
MPNPHEQDRTMPAPDSAMDPGPFEQDRTMPVSEEQVRAGDEPPRLERVPNPTPASPPAKNVSRMEHEEVEIYAEKSIRLRTGGGAVLSLDEEGRVAMGNKTGAQVLVDSDGTVTMMNAAGIKVAIDPAGNVTVEAQCVSVLASSNVSVLAGGSVSASGSAMVLEGQASVVVTGNTTTVLSSTTSFAGPVIGPSFNGKP